MTTSEPVPPPAEHPGRWREYAALVAVFVLSRLAVLAAFRARGLPFPYLDSADYVSLAEFIRDEGRVPVSDDHHRGGRLFPGLSILVAAVCRVADAPTAWGFVLSWAGGLAAVLLFHRLFRDLRLSVLHVLLLPSWVATSSCVLTEGLTFGLCLTGVLALRRPTGDRQRYALLAVAGYAVVCRNTAAFFVFPWLLGRWLSDPERSLGQAAKDATCLAALPAAYVAWAWLTVGEPLPQSAYQEETFASWSARTGHHYPPGLLTWPGRSLALGLTDDRYVRPVVKAVNWAHLALALVCLARTVRRWRSSAGPPPAWRPAEGRAVGLVFVVNLLFCLSISGVFGHSLFYRYLATHMNPVLLLLLFDGVRLPWWVVAVLGGVSVAAAAWTGSQA